MNDGTMKEFKENLAVTVAKGNEVQRNIMAQLTAKGFTVECKGEIGQHDHQNIWITYPSASATWKERIRLWIENPYGGVKTELCVELFPCTGSRGRTRKFKNHDESHIKKMVKDMFERINEYIAFAERANAADIERKAWTRLHNKTLQGMIIPPGATIRIVQEEGMPKEGHMPEFCLGFRAYGASSINNLRFNSEQLSLIFDGFAKAMGLATAWVIRIGPEQPVSEGRTPRNYYTGSWVTRYVNEAKTYMTEDCARQAAEKLSTSVKGRAIVCRYADEFLPDPDGKLQDAELN